MNRILSVMLVAGVVGGCGQQEPTADDPPRNSSQIHQPPTAVVEVSEGTNMAVALSPDGRHIVMSLQGTLFTLDASGGRAKAITDYYFDAREPHWSRDGSAIVFQGYRNGNWDLWRVDADGDHAEALTNDPFDDREPAFSPNNDDVVFSSDRGGSYDIWVVEGGEPRQLTSGPENEHSPAWSPDGSKIAFAANGEAGRYHIRVLDRTNGAIETVLTEAGIVQGIAWKPDGKQLSYQLRAGSAEDGLTARLKLLALDSGNTTDLSADDADVFPFRASWTSIDTLYYSASGQIRKLLLDEVETTVPFTAEFELNRAAYQRRKRDYDPTLQHRALGIATPSISTDGQSVVFVALGDMWLMDVSSKDVLQLTNDPFADQAPIFSPDGSKIAYLSDRSGRAQVWIYDLADKTTAALSGNMVLAGMSWSPEGERLAGFKDVPGNPLGGRLTIVDVASGEQRSFYHPIPPRQTSWRSDGKQIATAVLAPYSSRYREGVYNLLVIDLETGEATQMTPTRHRDMFDPVLSADDVSFTYTQEALLWRANVDGTGEPVKLTEVLTDNPSWSADGEYAVFMSADKVLRLQASTGEIEDITPMLHYYQKQDYRKQTPDKSDDSVEPVGLEDSEVSEVSEVWVLHVGKLFDGKTNRYRENVDVLIDGNRIEAISGHREQTMNVVDMSDKTIMPGLFEMHAHMGLGSESQGRAWLAYGVTSVRDPGSNPYVAKERQEAWDSGRRIGPRTHITGFLVDGNRVYYSIAEGLVSLEHLRRTLDRTRRLELDFIKTYVRLPDEWQKLVVDAAHEMGIPTSSHELFPAVSHGMDHVEHIGGTSRRGYQPKVSQMGYIYGDVIELLAKSGMGITPTLVLPGFAVIVKEDEDLFETPQFNTFYGAQVKQGLQMFFSRSVTAPVVAKANGKALRDLIDAGALVVTGTDSPFVPYGAGLHAELRLYVRAGLSPFETLRAATFSSATAAGVIDDVGTLEVGKLADIVVIDGDPLADIKDADNVVMTVKNGKAYSLTTLLTKPE